MGFGAYGKKVTYRLSGLTRVDVMLIAKERCKQAENNNSRRSVIDVDCNNIAHLVKNRSSSVEEEVAKHLHQWARYGAVIVPICDGDSRPVSKIQSHKNRSNREKNRIKAITSRRKLHEVNSRINNDDMSAQERAAAIAERAELEKAIKRSETLSSNPVPDNFPSLLEAELRRISAHDPIGEYGGYVAEVKTAEFQADAVIAGRFLVGKCDLIMSTDGDFTGFTNDFCISLISFMGNNITAVSTSEATLRAAVECLPPESKSKVKWEMPIHPIFEGVCDIRTRCLLGVIIGCDVSPGGVEGCGSGKVLEKLKTVQQLSCTTEDVYEELLAFGEEESKSTKADNAVPKYSKLLLNTLVDAIVFEPTNEIGATDRTYLDRHPIFLPSYLEEFKSASTTIVDGPAVIECKGCYADGSARHKFLKAEMHMACTDCSATFCQFCCQQSDGNKNEYRCFGCHVLEDLLPGENLNNLLSVAQMRKELKDKYNFDKVEDLSATEVQEIWDAHSLHHAIEELSDNIEFPLYPSASIETEDKWTELCEVDLSFGGSFIVDPDIDQQYIPGILDLLASFVKFDDSNKKQTTWQKDGPVFAAIPKMFIEFARKCRVDIGYRMLRRCVRHVFDSRTESLDNKRVKLILHEGEVGIAIQTEIPASMKADKYAGSTVLTKDKLLACSCGCKSGGQDNQRVACVHVFPRAFLLSVLLAQDLAEHILLELSSLMSSPDIELQSEWDSATIQSMKSSILVLMRASGRFALADEMCTVNTVYEMLVKFRTGTERTNEWKRVYKPPAEEHKGPMDLILVDSPEHVSQCVFHLAAPKKELPDRDANVVRFSPDYIGTDNLLNAAGICPSRFGPVGFRLFQMRLDKAKSNCGDGDESRRTCVSSLRQQYDLLMKDAQVRCHRNCVSLEGNKNAMKTPVVDASKDQHHETRKSVRLLAVELHNQPQQKKPKCSGNAVRTCVKAGCNNSSKDKSIGFNRLPPYPSKENCDTLKRIITYHGKRWLREESNDRCGLSRINAEDDLRVCNCHELETQTKTISFEFNGEMIHQTYEFDLITGSGMKSSQIPSMNTKGVGIDRYMQNELQFLSRQQGVCLPTTKQLRTDSPKTTLDMHERISQLEADKLQLLSQVATANLCMQQVVECHSPDKDMKFRNPLLERLGQFVPANDAIKKKPQEKRIFRFRRINTRRTNNSNAQQPSSPSENKHTQSPRTSQIPSVLPSAISDSEVKRRTGFPSISHLLGYIIIIANGNIDMIRRRQSPLTWFEEWFFYFEWSYHQTMQRQQDFEATWHINHHEMNDVKDDKLTIELGALLSWPQYASFKEDQYLRDNDKWSRYNGTRPVFWDMTNVPTIRFSDANLQRATFSEYYGMNCWKGGIGIQLCGWIRVGLLWGGGVSDSEYNNLEGYLNDQTTFAENDRVDGKVIPFTNGLDKGYRGKMSAFRHGKQMAIQPPFAKSDKRFRGSQTQYAGCIAHDRSGNERGVNVCKRSGMFQRKYEPTMCPRRLQNCWRVWSFRANFMYKPVV